MDLPYKTSLLGEQSRVTDDGHAHRLEYMADLILELKHMAEKAELPALANALGAAHLEASKARKARSG